MKLKRTNIIITQKEALVLSQGLDRLVSETLTSLGNFKDNLRINHDAIQKSKDPKRIADLEGYEGYLKYKVNQLSVWYDYLIKFQKELDSLISIPENW